MIDLILNQNHFHTYVVIVILSEYLTHFFQTLEPLRAPPHVYIQSTYGLILEKKGRRGKLSLDGFSAFSDLDLRLQ